MANIQWDAQLLMKDAEILVEALIRRGIFLVKQKSRRARIKNFSLVPGPLDK
jgi:hypothetical protein